MCKLAKVYEIEFPGESFTNINVIQEQPNFYRCLFVDPTYSAQFKCFSFELIHNESSGIEYCVSGRLKVEQVKEIWEQIVKAEQLNSLRLSKNLLQAVPDYV